MRLIVSYYNDKDPERRKEIDTCLINNLNNPHISEVICLIDDPNTELIDDRAKYIYIHERPTFEAAFAYSNDKDWNIVANSDIYFDESITFATQYTRGHFLALARHEVLPNGEIKLLNQPDAQDVWIYYGRIGLGANFRFGVPGCDNALAYKAEQRGYRVSNPSKTIKCYHLHNSAVRSYSRNEVIPQPYKLIWPHT